MTARQKVRLAAGSGDTFGVDDLACAAATYLGLWEDEGLDVVWTQYAAASQPCKLSSTERWTSPTAASVPC